MIGEAQPAAERPNAAMGGANAMCYWQPVHTCTPGRHRSLVGRQALRLAALGAHQRA